MMKTRDAVPILFALTGLLLSYQYVGAQQMTFSFGSSQTTQVQSTIFDNVFQTSAELLVSSNQEPCVSYAVSPDQYCSGVAGIQDLNLLLESGLTNETACENTLRQYACASVDKASNSTVFSIMKCYITDSSSSTAFVSQQSFSLFISKLSLDTLTDLLYQIDAQIPTSSISPTVKLYLLNAVWDRIRQDPDCACSVFPGSWFQRLSSFLSVIHPDILNCMINIPLTCDGFQTVVDALELAYPTLSNSTREMVGHWISQFLRRYTCPKPSVADWINSNYRSFKNNVNYADYVIAWPTIDVSSALDVLTDFQVAQYCLQTNLFSSPDKSAAVLDFLQNKDIFYLVTFLDTISQLSASAPLDNDLLFSLLRITLITLESPESQLCKPSFKEIFQVKIKFLLAAVNATVLDLFPTNTDCSDYQDMSQALDSAYSSYTDAVKYDVFQYKLNYITKETHTAGSGCTYGLSSATWLTYNFGIYSRYLTFADMIKLDPTFNGFDAIDLLTVNQTIDLIIYSNLLTLEAPDKYAFDITALVTTWRTKGYDYILQFLTEFSTTLQQHNILVIRNADVRCLLLDGIWPILSASFPQFSFSDWETWFNINLPIFLPCIKPSQLSLLTIGLIKDCSSFQTIIAGLNKAYTYMSSDTQQQVADWLGTFLSTTKCDSQDWLVVNWQQFRAETNLSVILQLNPDFKPLDVLTKLTANQIGEVVIYEDSARTNVDVIESVFNVLVDVPAQKVVKNLGSFWDTFNIVSEKSPTFTVTEEVEYTMLNLTTTQLVNYYPTFTAEDFNVWFVKRLGYVLPTVNTHILDEIPLTINCASYETLVNAFNFNFAKTATNNRRDIFNFFANYNVKGSGCGTTLTSFEWVQKTLASFSTLATYEQIISYRSDFNPYEPGVIKILTMDQIGDMIVNSNTLQSPDDSVLLFNYLKTQTVTEVDIVMTRFTATATQKKINIENVEVGSYILLNYLQIEAPQMQSFTTVQLVEMFEQRIYFFIQFFTPQTLNLIPVQDCNTLTSIVAIFNQAYGIMSSDTRTYIVNWIVSSLKSTELQGCYSPDQPQLEWIDITWKSFFSNVLLVDVLQVNPSFNIIASIQNTTIEQKVEAIMISDALVNVTTMEIVLQSLKGSCVPLNSIFEFLRYFNIAFQKLTVQTMSADVRQLVMVFLFDNMAVNFKFITAEQMATISVSFQYFLPGITAEVLNLIPLDISCSYFSDLFSAFSGVFSLLSDDLRNQVFNRIISYLNYNSALASTTGTVCSSLYTNSETYMNNIFFNFSYYATIYQLDLYYVNFNAYDVLEVLSATQLANLLMNTTAIRNQMQAVPILVELSKRNSYKDVSAFMVECNRVAQERNIVVLPDANVQYLIYQTVWSVVSLNLQTPADYTAWFGKKLDLLLPSMAVQEINLLPLNVDCTAQSAMVEGFSSAFSRLSVDQRMAFHTRIKTYLSDIKASSGSTCNSGKSSSTWIESNYGQFSSYASLQEFQSLDVNFNTEEALSVCTGTQIADFVTTSGGLRDEKTVTTVLEYLDTTQEFLTFYTQINTVAPNDLRNSPAIDLIVQDTFQTISVDFNKFTMDQWTQWFQVTLVNVLFAVNVTEVSLIPYPLPCDSFQKIIQGFSNAAQYMTEETKQMIYNILIKRQFDATLAVSGVICGDNIKRSQEWLDINFGVFAAYADYTDIMKWDTNFAVTEVITTLSVPQLAEVALQNGNINNEEFACQIVGRLEGVQISDVYSFLDQFNTLFQQMNIGQITKADVQLKYLSGSIDILKSQLAAYSTSQWDLLFSSRLKPFLPSINADLLGTLLNSANCNSYPIIVKYLNGVYDVLSPDTRRSLYNTLYAFLNAKVTSTGNACVATGETNENWLIQSFGKFSVYASYNALVTIQSNFNGMDLLSNLSPDQLAGLLLSGSVMSNESNINSIALVLQGMSFSQLDSFLSSLQSFAATNNIVSIANGQSVLLDAVFGTIANQFAVFTNEQYTDYFGSKLSLLLGGLTESDINLIPNTISCQNLQTIVNNLNNHRNEYLSSIQQEIYLKIKNILLIQQRSSGSACSVGAAGSAGWLQNNFASFSAFASYNDIVALNPNFIFTDAITSLTADQLGWYAIMGDAIRDRDKIAKVMTGINAQSLGAFLDAFNTAAKQNNIAQLPNAEVRKFLAGEIFCLLGPVFSKFTLNDFSIWFTDRLAFFISSLDAKSLGSIPTDISCDTLALLVEVFTNTSFIQNYGAIYDFQLSVLQQQKQMSGFACTSPDLSSRDWLLKYFGKFTKEVQWDPLVALYPTFDIASGLTLLSGNEAGTAIASTSIINSVLGINTVYNNVGSDIAFLDNMTESIACFLMKQGASLSNNVRDAILMRTFEALFSNPDTLSVSDAQRWMNQIAFLLPGINGTMLETISMDISCQVYEVIIASLDNIYTVLSPQRRIDVYNFEKSFLTNKFTGSDIPCSSGSPDQYKWLLSNMGRFCEQSTYNDTLLYYPNLDEVSYNRYCVLS
eukprot:XP_004918120.1 PREDICTED: uncharacterized protein LOC101733326 [Xenopus tropicalis]